MAKYTIEKDSLKIVGDKTSMTVTFQDEVNGKADCTCYHEIEGIEDTFIELELAKAALEYESRKSEVPESVAIPTGLEVTVSNEVITEPEDTNGVV